MRESPAGRYTPTARLLAGLLFTILIIGAYAAYTLRAVSRMREIQTTIVERNRLASLQLIRIQNDLNALGLSLRDMLDDRDEYPLAAWRPALDRIRGNLEDAIRREADLSAAWRPREQTQYLRASSLDFWRAVDTTLHSADRNAIRTVLQPRQEALTALVARLLVQNNERDSELAATTRTIYSDIEQNAWLLLGLSVVLIAITGLGLIRSNRRLFSRLETLANERRDLARQLISTQESAFRGISRDLHDEFGQILTALGALLRRARKLAPSSDFEASLTELNTIVQSTLEKTRSLSQSLQPVILEEQGLLAAIRWQLEQFERHTGIAVAGELPTADPGLPAEQSIHVYRILQEALNNVARHAGVSEVAVRLASSPAALRLSVEDRGAGIAAKPAGPSGIGLSAMRERAAILGGLLSISAGPGGAGTTVILDLPLSALHG